MQGGNDVVYDTHVCMATRIKRKIDISDVGPPYPDLHDMSAQYRCSEGVGRPDRINLHSII
jgi:hypothetical protein